MKTPGNLAPPPPAQEFNQRPLQMLLKAASGVVYRLHPLNAATGVPWPAICFSRRDSSRFDPGQGVGTLYLGDSLAGVMLEMFGDRLEPLGSQGRALRQTILREWFVSLISVPEVMPVAASGTNLSKLGVDLQLLAGEHAIARQWALRIMEHPAAAAGIWYPSRHDDTRRNLALFQRSGLLPAQEEPALTPPASTQAAFAKRSTGGLLYGRPVRLRDHPELMPALTESEVGLLP